MIALVALLALTTTQQASKNWSDLNSSLRVDGAKAVVFFDRGFADADHMKDTTRAWKPFDKGFKGNDSHVSILPMPLMAYQMGFNAKKKYLPSEDVAKMRDQVAHFPAYETIALSALLSTTLSNSSCVSKDPDTGKLTIRDVRVVMKVGDRVYQPNKQPGDILATYRREDYSYNVPDTVTIYRTEHNMYGDKQIPVGTTTSHHTESGSYELVDSNFSADFNLFDADGSPRILGKDKEIKIILIYGDKQREQTYKLSDLEKVNGKTAEDK